MKKLFLSLAVVMSLSMFSCGKADDKKTDANAEKTETPAAGETTGNESNAGTEAGQQPTEEELAAAMKLAESNSSETDPAADVLNAAQNAVNEALNAGE